MFGLDLHMGVLQEPGLDDRTGSTYGAAAGTWAGWSDWIFIWGWSRNLDWICIWGCSRNLDWHRLKALELEQRNDPEQLGHFAAVNLSLVSPTTAFACVFHCGLCFLCGSLSEIHVLFTLTVWQYACFTFYRSLNPGRWIAEPVCNTLSKGRTQVQMLSLFSKTQKIHMKKQRDGKTPQNTKDPKRTKDIILPKIGQKCQVNIISRMSPKTKASNC